MVQQFQIRPGMSLTLGEKVEVYYNIQKGGFSIKSIDKNNPNRGKVVAYAPTVSIENATFHINENKLAQIRAKNRKTVYAVVRGTLKSVGETDNSHHKQGYCNPFKTGEFIEYSTGERLEQAQEVYFYDKFFSFFAGIQTA